MASELVEAWRMGNEVNLFLLQEIPREFLKDAYSPRTRTVAGQFSHMHGTRLRWLRHAAPELVRGVDPFERGADPTAAQLKKALRASGKCIERFLDASAEAGRVKGWNGPPATFLGYLLAHEAHHRGLAMVAMRLAGHELPQKAVYGQWQWGMQRNLRG